MPAAVINSRRRGEEDARISIGGYAGDLVIVDCVAAGAVSCDVVRADRLIPSVVAEVVRRAPLCPEKVDFAWRAAVGSVMQRATSVRLDEHGALHVTATDAHWAREVKRSSKLILARLETMLGPGTVKRMRVNQGA
jgi:hypothetical protein